MFNCPNCGEELPDDSVFCESCGSKVTNFGAQAPSAAEAVKPAKKGKSLKIFLAGMLAVIVILCTVVLPRTDFFSNFNPLSAIPFLNSGDGESGDKQSNDAENAASTSDGSANESSASNNASNSGTATSSNTITSVVGTWTDTDGNKMIFSEDGSLLCMQQGNNGAYTMYVGGTYEQNKDDLEFKLAICQKDPKHKYNMVFGNNANDFATATIVNDKINIPLNNGNTAVLTQTSKTETSYAPLSKVFGTTVTSSWRNTQMTVQADGIWKGGVSKDYWVCYTGKKSGTDYGQGTLVFMIDTGGDYGSYTIPTN